MQRKQNDSLTTISSLTLPIAAALERGGVDPAKVFEKAGVHISTTADPMQRLSSAQINKLFEEGAKATGNHYFGIAVAECVQPGNLHALGYALLSSTSLRNFCERLSKYYCLIYNSGDIKLIESEGAAIICAGTDAYPNNETEDAFACYVVRVVRFISQSKLNPIFVSLTHAAPKNGVQPYIDYFRCKVELNQPRIQIGFNADILDTPLNGGSLELAQIHDQTIRQYLEKLNKEDIVNRVKTLIVDRLPDGGITKQKAAASLHMSPRNLQLKLAAQNTSFQELFEQIRQSLAMSYIEQSGLSITEVAYKLGFSDSSNFTRAFKRWTNLSPTEFRQSINIA